MLITNHVLSGALVGHACRGPGTAFAAGVVSHLALDAVPHWGGRPIAEVMPVAVTDGLVGLAALTVLSVATPAPRRLRVMAAMAGACVLDLDKPCTIFLGASPFPEAVDRFHGAIQRESMRRMPQEVLVALAGAALCAWVTRRPREGQRASQASKASVR